MCEPIRLVLLGNDERLSDYAFAEVIFVIFQISLRLSAELADLQNAEYLSTCFRSFSSIVMGILKSL